MTFSVAPLTILDEKKSRGADRHDLVFVSVESERRHIKLLEIFCEIRFGESFNAVGDGFVSGQHPLEPERIAQTLRNLGARPVGTIERRRRRYPFRCHPKAGSIGHGRAGHVRRSGIRGQPGIPSGLPMRPRSRASRG